MKKTTIFTLLTLAVAFTLVSWGVVGHRAIGQIAENHLSKKSAKAVKDLLGTESLAMVSTYPDEIRSYKQYAYTAPWHYVNVPQGLSQEDFSSEVKNMDKDNIYKALRNCINDLKDQNKSRDEKVFALKFLVHLVGDLHQPMHTGRAEDLGGNNVKVKLMRKETNLHGLWDSSLIDYAGLTYKELAKECDVYKKEEVKQWQQEDILKWIYESYQIGETLYQEAEQSADFDYNYYPKHADVVKKRLAQAGIRLAGLLNEIYK